MDQGQIDVALRATEVPMLEPEIVRQIRGLAAMSWGSKRIAATLGISRGAARRYLRGAAPGAQERPRARRLDADQRAVAVTLPRWRGGRQCGGRAAAPGRARDRGGAAHSAAGSGAASPGSPRRRSGDGALRDSARSSAPDRLRRATRPHRRSRDARLLLRRSARLFEAGLRAGVPARATRRLARGARRRVRAFRRRHADGARRQCARADPRPRQRVWSCARAPSVQRVLRRLGRRAASLPSVSSTDKGQDGVRRRLREAQCRRGPPASTASPRSRRISRRG